MNKHLLPLVLAALIWTDPAAAQLSGTDTKPGDACTAAEEGYVRRNASADRDASEITLICDGSVWQSAVGSGASVVWLNDGPGGPAEIYYNGGNVGIGTNDPTTIVNIVGDGGISDDFHIHSYSDTDPTWAGGFTLFRARGTEGTPATVQADDYLGTIYFSGHNGSGFVGGAQIVAQAETDYSGAVANRNASLVFTTIGSGTFGEKMRIMGNGNVGIGTADPREVLGVAGTVQIGRVDATTEGGEVRLDYPENDGTTLPQRGAG